MSITLSLTTVIAAILLIVALVAAIGCALYYIYHSFKGNLFD